LGGFIAGAADSIALRKFWKWNSAVCVAALIPNSTLVLRAREGHGLSRTLSLAKSGGKISAVRIQPALYPVNGQITRRSRRGIRILEKAASLNGLSDAILAESQIGPGAGSTLVKSVLLTHISSPF
jgi:hypothetical protein